MRIRIRIQLKIFPGSRSRSGGGGGCRSAKNVHPPWPNPRYAPGLRTVQQSSPPPSPLQDVAVNLLSLQLARRPYPHGPHPGFGSGSWSELDPDSIGSVDPDPEKRERGTEGGWVGLGYGNKERPIFTHTGQWTYLQYCSIFCWIFRCKCNVLWIFIYGYEQWIL